MTHEADNALIAEPTEMPSPKRGRGRPRGSRNKPKPPAVEMSVEEQDALRRELAGSYSAAVAENATAQVRLRGVKQVIIKKLGREGLAEVEAAFIKSTAAQQDAAEYIGPPLAVAGHASASI